MTRIDQARDGGCRYRTATFMTVIIAFAGCATTPAPVEQVKFFSQAFVAVNTVGQPLLDDMAIAERAVGRRSAERRAKAPPESDGDGSCSSKDATWTIAPSDNKLGFIDGFCLRDVGYFAELGDPPATALLRGGLQVIERYADVLSSLVEGRNLERALGEVDALGQEVGGLVALAGGQVALGSALTALRPVLSNIAKQANAQEARRLILEGAPLVSDLIAALRNAVPEMFKVLIAGPRRGVDASSTAQAAITEIAIRRQVMSQYVFLLDRLQAAWNVTVDAAKSPGGTRLAEVVAGTAELRADAEAVRRSMAVLRSRGVGAP